MFSSTPNFKSYLIICIAVFGLFSCNGRFRYFIPEGGQATLPSTALPTLSVSSISVPEQGVANVTVSLSQLSSHDISFSYSTQDLSALAGQQYSPTSGTLTILAGQISRTISIPIYDNLNISLNTFFNIQISSPSGAALGSSDATVLIVDTDNDLSNVVELSSGVGSNKCAVLNTGRVVCWGAASLGDGTWNSSGKPVSVDASVAGAIKVATSSNSSCAVLSVGQVKCWGNNGSGQLGNGLTVNSALPVDVSSISTAIDVAVGTSHACALLSDGSVNCWGANWLGQLGDGTNTDSLSPVTVSGLGAPATEIISSSNYSCALLNTGLIKCWGANFNGELGDGTFVNKNSAVSVSGIINAVQISAGTYSVCATLADGTVRCWGANTTKQLGDGTTITSNTPVTPINLSGFFTKISVETNGACALNNIGSMYCWGNTYYLGAASADPTLKSVSGAIDQLSGVDGGNCALMSDSTVKCWGYSNYNSQLGRGFGEYIPYALDIENLNNISQLSPGVGFGCVLTNSGAVKCWGSGGSLGNGNSISSEGFQDVVGLSSGITKIASGWGHSCAINAAGAVICWGYNSSGEIGNGTTVAALSPTSVTGINGGAILVALADGNSCAVVGTGIKCWGANNFGQLGNGSSADSTTPVDVIGVSGTIEKLSAGVAHYCALLSTNEVKCWGRNNSGELGNGLTANSASAVTVAGLGSADVTDISTGWGHSCALLSDGLVKCWGGNWSGQLGDGTTTSSLIPVTVNTTDRFAKINMHLADSYSCGVTTEGAAKCWGGNWYGQLGNETFTDQVLPTQVVGLAGGVTDIFVSLQHACALLITGEAKCWGSNEEQGLGNKYKHSYPINVINY